MPFSEKSKLSLSLDQQCETLSSLQFAFVLFLTGRLPEILDQNEMTTLRREIFTWIYYFHESIFFNISRGFNIANWSQVVF